MPFDSARLNVGRQQTDIYRLQNKITGQNRLLELREDPMAAARAVRYESQIARLERFEGNTRYARDHFNLTYAYMDQAVNVIQRVRELAVQAANGIYTPSDMKLIGAEVNEMLNELVSIANVVGPDGKQLFGGDKVFTEPFRAIEGMVEGGDNSMVQRVEYRGAGASRSSEVGDRNFVELDLEGGRGFWAERMQVFSGVDASAYRVREPGSFFIDGVEIAVSVGDTLPSIVAKINDSPAPVKAFVDPETRGLALEGTGSQFIRAEDAVGGAAVLQDLGIVRGTMENGITNWDHTRSTVSGGSLFDMVVRLRDALFRGDHEFVGSQGLSGLDGALDGLANGVADIGSRQERVQTVWTRLNREITDVQSYLARETGVDMASAATNLAIMELAHKAGLQTMAKLVPVSLLDFLR